MDLGTIIFIAILLFSVVIHEVAHGFAADKLGDPTARYQGRLTLNPLAHLDPVGSVLVPVLTVLSTGIGFGWAKPVPYNPYNIKHPYGDLIVAGAGPLSNILIALIFGLLLRFDLVTGMVAGISEAVVLLNLSLALFNLIPVPPLDGSKILGQFLPWDARERYLNIGIAGIPILLVVLFVVWPAISPWIYTLKDLLVGV